MSVFTTLAFATTVEVLTVLAGLITSGAGCRESVGSEAGSTGSCAKSDNDKIDRINAEHKVVILIIFVYGLGCKATLFCLEIIGFF